MAGLFQQARTFVDFGKDKAQRPHPEAEAEGLKPCPVCGTLKKPSELRLHANICADKQQREEEEDRRHPPSHPNGHAASPQGSTAASRAGRSAQETEVWASEQPLSTTHLCVICGATRSSDYELQLHINIHLDRGDLPANHGEQAQGSDAGASPKNDSGDRPRRPCHPSELDDVTKQVAERVDKDPAVVRAVLRTFEGGLEEAVEHLSHLTDEEASAMLALEPEAQPVPEFTCPICQYDFPVTALYTLNCPSSHRLCLECAVRAVEVAERAKEACRCPTEGCDYSFPDDEVRQILLLQQAEERGSPQTALRGKFLELQQRYQAQSLKNFLAAHKEFIGCPTPDCVGYVEVQPPLTEKRRCECPACHTTYCSLCREAPYHYRCSCQELRALEAVWLDWTEQGRQQHQQQEQAKEAEFAAKVQAFELQRAAHEREQVARRNRFQELQQDEAWKQANLRCCPSCKRPIEKVAGCDLMVCGRNYHGGDQQNGCGHNFNWTQALPYSASVAHLTPDFGAFTGEAPKADARLSHGEYLRCDFCHLPVAGLLFQCLNCPCFNLCSGCEPRLHSQDAHPPSHIFRIHDRPTHP